MAATDLVQRLVRWKLERRSTRAGRASEDQGVIVISDGIGQVFADFASNGHWDCHGAETGSGIRWPESQGSVLSLNERCTDGQSFAVRIEVAAAQCRQFAIAETRERGKQDEGAKSVRHKVCKCKHLVNCRGRAFCGTFKAGTWNPTRVTADEFVINGGIQNGSKEPIRLRCHGHADVSGKEFGAPCAN